MEIAKVKDNALSTNEWTVVKNKKKVKPINSPSNSENIFIDDLKNNFRENYKKNFRQNDYFKKLTSNSDENTKSIDNSSNNSYEDKKELINNLSPKKVITDTKSIDNSSNNSYEDKKELINNLFPTKVITNTKSIDNLSNNLSENKKKSIINNLINSLSPKKVITDTESNDNLSNNYSSQNDINSSNKISLKTNIFDIDSSVVGYKHPDNKSNMKYEDIYNKFKKKKITSTNNNFFLKKSHSKDLSNSIYINIINQDTNLKFKFNRYSTKYKNEKLNKFKKAHESIIDDIKEEMKKIELSRLNNYIIENMD